MPGLTPRLPIASSMIQSAGYDAQSQTLDVEFKNGRIYSYANVPQSEYDGLMGASSAGKFFLSNIKGVYSEA